MPTTHRKVGLYRLLLLTFIAVPVANYLPFLLADGRAEARFADDNFTYVQAAGYAFSIWGIIFIGMILFAWGRLRKNAEPPTEALHRGISCLMVAGLASIAFVPLSFGDNQFMIWLDIAVHLIALIIANQSLQKHCRIVERGDSWRWSFFAPSVYMGWISAAFVISTALMLDYIGFNPSNQVAIALAMILIGTLFFIGRLLINHQDMIYGLTVAWALVAVGVEQSAVPSLQYLAWGGAAGLVAVILFKSFTGSKLLYWRNA
ncbi:MAG: hypothetical protein AAGF87_04790 [Bacteroidota bacterium]